MKIEKSGVLRTSYYFLIYAQNTECKVPIFCTKSCHSRLEVVNNVDWTMHVAAILGKPACIIRVRRVTSGLWTVWSPAPAVFVLYNKIFLAFSLRIKSAFKCGRPVTSNGVCGSYLEHCWHKFLTCLICGQRRLSSDCANAQSDPSHCWPHVTHVIGFSHDATHYTFLGPIYDWMLCCW